MRRAPRCLPNIRKPFRNQRRMTCLRRTKSSWPSWRYTIHRDKLRRDSQDTPQRHLGPAHRRFNRRVAVTLMKRQAFRLPELVLALPLFHLMLICRLSHHVLTLRLFRLVSRAAEVPSNRAHLRSRFLAPLPVQRERNPHLQNRLIKLPSLLLLPTFQRSQAHHQ